MKRLLADPERFYSPKKRPSGHDISAGFRTDNGGAIPSNLLSIPNSDSNSTNLAACKALSVRVHSARFPPRLPQFFIRFLTDPGDQVVDIFAGSNTTGMVAESEGRRWFAFDNELEFLAASVFRFFPEGSSEEVLRDAHGKALAREPLDLASMEAQTQLFAG
jgi:site-specific DNA-methyltransferase (cytosine-N4-specific)